MSQSRKYLSYFTPCKYAVCKTPLLIDSILESKYGKSHQGDNKNYLYIPNMVHGLKF